MIQSINKEMMQEEKPLHEWRIGRLAIEHWSWSWVIGLGYVNEHGFQFLFVQIGNIQVQFWLGDGLL